MKQCIVRKLDIGVEEAERPVPWDHGISFPVGSRAGHSRPPGAVVARTGRTLEAARGRHGAAAGSGGEPGANRPKAFLDV